MQNNCYVDVYKKWESFDSHFFICHNFFRIILFPDLISSFALLRWSSVTVSAIYNLGLMHLGNLSKYLSIQTYHFTFLNLKRLGSSSQNAKILLFAITVMTCCPSGISAVQIICCR